MHRNTISVLISTYRRKKYLLHTMECLNKQFLKPLEVVIIDSSPEEEILQPDDLKNFQLNIIYLRCENFRNVSKQRNIGARQIKGDIILFIDDDVDFDEYFVKNHLDLYEDNKFDAISGLVDTPLLPYNSPPFEDKTKFTSPHALNYQPCDIIVESYVVCTANLSVRRLAFENVGGFDENNHGVLEDVGLGLSLKRAGYSVFHHNKPKLYHYMAPLSGRRAVDINRTWFYTNNSYFQINNFYRENPYRFLLLMLKEKLRPSKKWLKPINFISDIKNSISGFLTAKKRIK